MSSKLAILNEQINELETQLESADKERRSAVSALAAAPTDADSRVKARTAATFVEELRADLMVLREAAAALEDEEDAEGVRAKKQEAVAILRNVEKLAVKRTEAAEAVDAALADFSKVMHQWVSVNAQVRAEVIEFYRLTIPHTPTRHSRILELGGLTAIAGNAVACQLEEAVCSAQFVHNTFFNFRRNLPDEPELVARDSASDMVNVLSTMRRHIAEPDHA